MSDPITPHASHLRRVRLFLTFPEWVLALSWRMLALVYDTLRPPLDVKVFVRADSHIEADITCTGCQMKVRYTFDPFHNTCPALDFVERAVKDARHHHCAAAKERQQRGGQS